MADVVGNIKAYHNGSSYNVADIYDEKEISEKTVVLVHFNENGLIDEYNNNWVYYYGTDTTQPCSY